MLADQMSQLVNLLLRDPETQDPLVITSPIFNNPDGSFYYKTTNPNTQAVYKTTVLIEQITPPSQG